ncbi:hypothetical protein K1719_043632 [Acacia pycnantha]|nr:hypothetical protein K1719_043632 [Acacia pycnantha]
MASGMSLQRIFENPLPEKPTLMQSLSLKQIRIVKPIDDSSFTELFGELHFKESPRPSPSSSLSQTSPSLDLGSDTNQISVSSTPEITPESNHIIRHKSSDSFSSYNSESLHFCTEGLGCESSDDMEDLKAGMDEYCWETKSEIVSTKKKNLASKDSYGECRRSRIRGLEYPPPISCIGSTGKPWVLFKSYRDNGRFVLKEIRIPTREFLYADREDGRLKLRFVMPDDEFREEQNDEEEDDDDDDDAERIDGEEKDDGVVCMDEREENTEKEKLNCARDQGNEGKEIDV